MKRSIVLVMAVLLGFAVSAGLAAQDAGVYHLVVIDRARCPGETVGIDEPLAAFAHGQTGYYIVFGKGAVTLPSGAQVVVNLTSPRASVISGYLNDPSFRRYVSSQKVLEGIRFVVNEETRETQKTASFGSQGNQVYHLVVVDRDRCPGATVSIEKPLAAFAHGQTGYYILFGRGAVTLPPGAEIVEDMTAQRASVISGYLDDPSFRRYVSSPKVLDGIRFAIKAEGK